MTGKLLKYELKATARVMLPLYLVMILATLVMAVNLDSGKVNNFILNTIINAAFFIAVFVCFVVGTLMILQRFYKNLLGSEGYLMFTLPVTTMQNILGKALASLIWIMGSVAVGAVCGLIFIRITGDLSSFIYDLQFAWQTISSRENPWLYLIMVIALIAAGILERIMKIYASISAGHQWSSHRILGSILAYAAFSAIEYLLAWMFKLRIWIDVAEANMRTLTVLLCIAGAGIAAYGFIAWYLLDRHLNLE